MEEPQQSFGLPNPSPEVKPRSFSDDTPNQAVEAPQPKLSLPKPPFSGHSAIPPVSGIPQPSFSWPTRIPYQQLPTCNSILQRFFLANQVSQQQQATTSVCPQPSFPGPPGFPTSSYQPATAICRSFLANQGSQQQQAKTSVIPQRGFPGQTGFPTSSYQPATAFCSSFSGLMRFLSSSKQQQASVPSLVFLANQASPPAATNLQQPSAEVSWLTRVPSSSKQRQASFHSVVFPSQTGFPTSSYQPATAFCSSFLANQGSQQQQAKTSVIPQRGFSWPNWIPHQQLPTCNSILQQFFLANQGSQQQQATTSVCPQPSFPGPPGFPTSSYQPATAICRSFLANQGSQQQQAKTSVIPQRGFPGQTGFPTSSYQPATAFCSSFSWLTRFLSSSKQQQASVPSLVFLANQASPPAATNLQQPSAEVSWLTRVPSSSKQRQASFHSVVFPSQTGFPTSSYQPATAFCSSFLANQGSQQQQAKTSVIPQRGFSWPNWIPHQQLPTCNSILQQFFLANQGSQQQQATTSVCPQPSFPGQPGFRTSIYQPAAAICRSFPG